MLIRVKVACDPGHSDDEGEDGEADDEKDLVGHDLELMFAAEQEGESRENRGKGRSGRGFVYLFTTYVGTHTSK